MTQKSAAKPSTEASAKLIVFGVDDDCKPHAAVFSKAEAGAARAAAKQLRLNVVEVTNGTAAEWAGKLPAGRIHANGPGVVPAVREELYEKLVATINSKGEAGREPGEPVAADVPASFDAIKPGHIILAHEGLVEGWWVAVVVERSGDKLSMRWRDYPGHPKFTQRVTAVALLHPAGA